MSVANKVLPGGGWNTDVGTILATMFPQGNPEMSAVDFKNAYALCNDIKVGKHPAKTSLDFTTWAHCLLILWKMECDLAKRTGHAQPNQLLCPECNTALVLDQTQSNVLTCLGGCNRAITVLAFADLFKVAKKPPKKNQQMMTGLQAFAQSNGGGFWGGLTAPAQTKDASIVGHIPVGTDPVEAGIVEKMPKSRKPLTSWRVWRVMDDRQPPRLKSISHEAYWPAMEPIESKCMGNSSRHEGACPSWHGRCGVYSVKTLKDIEKWSSYAVHDRGRVGVVGEIEMWGRVLEYKDGYRSEFAYPLRLILPEDFDVGFDYDGWSSPEDLAEKLWMTYLVEVIIDSDAFYRRMFDDE